MHAGIYGPIDLLSLVMNKYFSLFVDDFSYQTWDYFLIEKIETFETFKKFEVLVETENGHLIKALRINRVVSSPLNNLMTFGINPMELKDF